MGSDHTALQWLFNVVTITGFSSLVVFCYVLKQDNRKLTLALAQGQPRERQSENPTTGSAAPGSMPELKTDRKALPLEHQDIRQFVAQRSHHWFATAR